jgi:hypothetical protein
VLPRRGATVADALGRLFNIAHLKINHSLTFRRQCHNETVMAFAELATRGATFLNGGKCSEPDVGDAELLAELVNRRLPDTLVELIAGEGD